MIQCGYFCDVKLHLSAKYARWVWSGWKKKGWNAGIVCVSPHIFDDRVDIGMKIFSGQGRKKVTFWLWLFFFQFRVKVTDSFIDYIRNQPIVFEIFGHFSHHPLHDESKDMETYVAGLRWLRYESDSQTFTCEVFVKKTRSSWGLKLAKLKISVIAYAQDQWISGKCVKRCLKVMFYIWFQTALLCDCYNASVCVWPQCYVKLFCRNDNTFWKHSNWW